VCVCVLREGVCVGVFFVCATECCHYPPREYPEKSPGEFHLWSVWCVCVCLRQTVLLCLQGRQSLIDNVVLYSGRRSDRMSALVAISGGPVREIQTLAVTILKEIAKTPAKFVNDKSFERAREIANSGFDLSQVVVDYVIEAGRFTDDSLPLCIFTPDRTSLVLKNSKISPVYLSKIISRCPNLTSLDVSGTFLVDDECVTMILQMCPMIKHLGLQSCRKLSNQCLETVTRLGRNIDSLQLGGNFNITNDGLVNFLRTENVAQLVELSFAGLPLSDEVLMLIGRKCQLLRKLSFAYCICTEASLRTMLTQVGGQLESLSVAWIGTALPDIADYQITSDFIADFLPRYCPKLKDLDVCGLKNITATSLLGLLDYKLQQVCIMEYFCLCYFL
jgi:hypothetical protein